MEASRQRLAVSDLGSRFAVDLLSAGTAALSITPIVCLIDSTIMLRAATSRPFMSCVKTFVTPVSKLPHNILFSIPARLVFAVYFGTYTTANSIDTITSYTTAAPATTVTANTSKFVGTATVSTALTVYKDSRMAKCIGKSHLASTVPAMTYGLFTLRDAITIFASFNLPTLLAPSLTKVPPAVQNKLGGILQTEAGRFRTAQFMIPAAVQLVTTPIHLLGLDMYNRREKVNLVARCRRVAGDFGVAVPARIARIVPAFGLGGVINASTRHRMMQGL